MSSVPLALGFFVGSRALHEVLRTYWFPKYEGNQKDGLPHGTILGTTKGGVVGYNCNYKNNPDAEGGRAYDYSNFYNNQFSGMKWQCVEFARRYWMIHYNVVLPAVQWAAHIWKLKIISIKRDGKFFSAPLQMCPNGGQEKPSVGDLLIYKANPRVGHVAVVVEVLQDRIRVAEQNNNNDRYWAGGYYADELPMVESAQNGSVSFTCTNSDSELILEGWVRLRIDQEGPREKWIQPKAELSVDGVYDKMTCSILQALCGGFADGDHGGLTSSNLRTFLHVHGRAEDKPDGISPSALISSLRKFLIAHLNLCRPNRDAVCTTALADLEAQSCDIPSSVCLAIMKAAPGYADSGEVLDSSIKCLTTVLLQEFLNNIRVAEDIPNAMEQFA